MHNCHKMSYNIITKNLIVGDYKTAQNFNLLKHTLGVTHIVACGFDKGFFADNNESRRSHVDNRSTRSNRAGKNGTSEKVSFTYFLVNILDEPSSNLLQYLPRVVNFIQNALEDTDQQQGQGRGHEGMHMHKSESEPESEPEPESVVYIHCVHGQSRSCAVCISFLVHCYYFYRSMGKKKGSDKRSGSGSKLGSRSDLEELIEQRFSLRDDWKEEDILHGCYEIVKKARPCMAVNPGFVRQLEIFRQMKAHVHSYHPLQSPFNFVGNKNNNVGMLQSSRAHATFRTYRARAEFYNTGTINTRKFHPNIVSTVRALSLSPSSSLLSAGVRYYVCQKCSQPLFTDQNIILDLSPEEVSKLPASDYWADSYGGTDYYSNMHVNATKAHSNSVGAYSQESLFQKMLKHSDSVWKLEPMQWMSDDMTMSIGSDVYDALPVDVETTLCSSGVPSDPLGRSRRRVESQGSLTCPNSNCRQGLGRWDWCHSGEQEQERGLRGGLGLSPSIFILKAKIDEQVP